MVKNSKKLKNNELRVFSNIIKVGKIKNIYLLQRRLFKQDQP